MKKKVMCFLFLAVFLLTACTFLSTKIEEEMMTQVTVHNAKPKKAGAGIVSLPVYYLYFEDETIDAIHRDYDGVYGAETYTLYQLENGSGWEEGLRVYEVDQEAYHLDPLEYAVVGFDETRGWSFISCASRRPQVGQKVEILKNEEKGTEYYLLRYPSDIPTVEFLPPDMTILAQEGNSMVVSLKNVPQAMLYQRTRQMLGDYGTLGIEIYSLRAVDQFLHCLPPIAGVAVLLIFALVIWVQSYILLKNDWENRFYLAANALMGLALLWGLWQLLQRIDLPASLLPGDSILNLGYYQQESASIFEALRGLSRDFFLSVRTLGRTGQNTLNLARRMIRRTELTVLAGLAATVLWVSLPALLGKARALWQSRTEQK